MIPDIIVDTKIRNIINQKLILGTSIFIPHIDEMIVGIIKSDPIIVNQ